MKTLLTVAFLLLSAPALAQPTIRDRVDVGLGLAGLSSASIALGLTMSCTSDRTCRENNPLMAKWIGQGPVKATVVKATLNSVSYYAIWRGTHNRPKTRTLLLAAVTAINVWDAAHDIRQARRH